MIIGRAQIAAVDQQEEKLEGDDDDRLRRLYLAAPAYMHFLTSWANGANWTGYGKSEMD